ncbi:solute carrier family 22 member 4 isoform X1 [Octopus bimaculoides]|nr:solute carrier family 22 member 4 isoform X1 [Octopus bimaculoides]XP_014769923.1 solute carrier family 22 member 4 isoform X1 [Octopus bimaculoides]|eukprot:XP_014769921.1 PREDICTED: solute carrier family 22 member 4-like isoform X1 [Octopus bimaculoides]
MEAVRKLIKYICSLTMQADEVLQLFNNYGKYPRIIYFLLCFVILRGVFSVFSIMYIAPTTSHTCKSDRWNSSSASVVTSDCSVFVYNGTDNVTYECMDWSYDKSPEESIIAQWNLVCNQDYIIHLSTAIYMVGNLFGCLILMPFADKFGRKLILNFLLSIQLILNFVLIFSNSIITFTILRFFIGAANITIALLAYCMLSEVLPSTRRTLRVIGASSFWSLGIMSLALFGALISDWKILQIVLSLPNLVVIFLCWHLPESISWLFTHKKFGKIMEIFKCAAKWDKKNLPCDFNLETLQHSQNHDLLLNDIKVKNDFPSNSTLNKSQDSSYEQKSYQSKNSIKDSQEQPAESTENPCAKPGNSNKNITENDTWQCTELMTLNIKSLFSTPRMLGYTLIMFYISTINSLSYFGIILSTPSLPGNLSWNLFWTAICEIFAYIVTMLIANKLGCRYPMSAMMLIAGFSNLIAYVLITFYTFQTPLIYIFTILCTMVGRFGMSGSYSILYLLFTELFPTAIRNQAMGFASFFENLGGIFAPIILLTTKDIPFVILIIFGVLNVIGAILVLLLPETHLKALPESVEQIEGWSEKPFYQIFCCRTVKNATEKQFTQGEIS